MTQLTPHFTLAEACVTQTGLPNLTSPEERERILHTAHQMEIVRAVLLRNPIHINSWFRSQLVNKRVGGVPNSEHRFGTAVDFTCPRYGSPFEVAQSLLYHSHIVNYNQLIYEGGWVHISFPLQDKKGKLETLTVKNGKYTQGLTL